MQQRIIVSGVVQNGDKILLGKKAKGQPPYPDVWHTLGGGIEGLKLGTELLKSGEYDNQYFHEELKRELLEEASIQVSNIKNICPQYRETPREGITKNKHGEETHYIFLEYLCKLEEGEASPGDDIAEIRWATKVELCNIPLTPPSLEMYKELGYIF